MSELKFPKRLRSNTQALNKYCTALGWDRERIDLALYPTGLSAKETYLEAPNERVVEGLAEFLTVSGSALFLISAENGMGKSAIKEFCLRVMGEDEKEQMVFSIDSPRHYSDLQLMKQIYTQLTETKAPGAKERVSAGIESALIALRQVGVTTQIWVDEGQTLTLSQLALLRTISDIKTPEGYGACKVLILGTPTLKNKIEVWLTKCPEEAGAFDDRVALYSLDLKPWTPNHIAAWLECICEFVSTRQGTPCNPFTNDFAQTLHSISEGKPRNIVQLTHLAILHAARTYATSPTQPKPHLTIPGQTLIDAIECR